MLSVVIALVACDNVLPAGAERTISERREARQEQRDARRELWVLDTSRGRIVVRLFPDAAPKTVAQVRQWTRNGIYDGTWFHRVVREPRPFIVQGGDPDSRGLAVPSDPLELDAVAETLGFGTTDPVLPVEATARRHTRGAVSLAVSESGVRAGPQFVIALADLPHLDGVQPVFGQVEGGWSVVGELEVGDRIERARLLATERIDGDWIRDIP
jgi:peptidyl-prolyl cis-trans isomerase B (cyclophilin B)